MTVQEFDFRQPPPGSLEAKVTAWLTEACNQSARKWSRLLAFDLELKNPQVESLPTNLALGRVSETAIGFRLNLEGDSTSHPLLIIPRPLLLVFLAGSFGEKIRQLPKDREFTTVETTMTEFLVQTLLLELFQETWPLANTPKFLIQERGVPGGINLLPLNDLQLYITFTLLGPFGEQTFSWILPRSGFLDKLMEPSSGAELPSATTPDEMARLVEEMPVELSVSLGSAQITLFQLAMIQKGDVLILEQKVTEPLSAKVGGIEKFQVWPGAVGKRQAVQIGTIVEK